MSPLGWIGFSVMTICIPLTILALIRQWRAGTLPDSQRKAVVTAGLLFLVGYTLLLVGFLTD